MAGEPDDGDLPLVGDDGWPLGGHQLKRAAGIVEMGGGGGHGAPHFARIVRSDSCSARLIVSQRSHATGSINSTSTKDEKY